MSKIKLKKLDGEDLKTLFIDLIDGTAQKRVYQFNRYKIRIGDSYPVSGAERVRRWYERNSIKVNKIRKKTYHLRKEKGLCIKCYDTTKAIKGVLCKNHYLTKRNNEKKQHTRS